MGYGVRRGRVGLRAEGGAGRRGARVRGPARAAVHGRDRRARRALSAARRSAAPRFRDRVVPPGPVHSRILPLLRQEVFPRGGRADPPSRNRGARPDDRRAAQERQRPAYSRHRNGERLHSRDAGGRAAGCASDGRRHIRYGAAHRPTECGTPPADGPLRAARHPDRPARGRVRSDRQQPTLCDGGREEAEPHRALFVPDDDPLLFYRAIAGLGRRLFAPGGTVYFEINERFGTQTVELLENEGYREIVLSKDFFGKPRTVSARWK